MTLGTIKTRLKAIYRAEISEFWAEVNDRIDYFKGRVFVQFSDIKAYDLGMIREKVAIL